MHDSSRATLDAIAPELAEIPLPFIYDQITENVERMLLGLHTLSLPNTIDRLLMPATLTVSVPPDPQPPILQPMYPTHVLAVSLPTSTAEDPLTLIPIHGIVLAANCTASILPPTPPHADSIPETMVLPICPILLPSVDAFLILRMFMYTHRVETLLGELLPLPGNPVVQYLEEWETRVEELDVTVEELKMEDSELRATIVLARELVRRVKSRI